MYIYTFTDIYLSVLHRLPQNIFTDLGKCLITYCVSIRRSDDLSPLRNMSVNTTKNETYTCNSWALSTEYHYHCIDVQLTTPPPQHHLQDYWISVLGAFYLPQTGTKEM